MSSVTYANVPFGMSYVDAVYALYQAIPHCSRKSKLQEKKVNIEKMNDIYRTNQGYIEIIGGKRLKIDCSEFPRIKVTEYNKRHGKNAQEILDKYAQIPSEKRFEKTGPYKNYRYSRL